MKIKLKYSIYGWLLLLPSFVLLIGFTHYPVIASLYDSFFSNQTIIRPKVFLGLDNYMQMLNDPVFMQSLKNSFYFSLTTVPASIVLSLVMAIFVHKRLTARGLVRLAYFTPTMLPMVAVANIWLFFYAPEIGLLNQILEFFGFSGHNWLGESDTVLNALVAMTIWKEAGFFMIFYLAALQSISKELLEAAKVEGATDWKIFYKVTFPLLMPTTFFVLINALLNSFKLVDPLFILTQGGPDNASNLLLYYIYEVAFSFFDYAYASSLTVVLLVILAVVSLLWFGFLEKKIHYR